MRSDRYAAIKKLCIAEKPVANQCCNLKTISNEKKVTSVVQKIALQINCKLGGEVRILMMDFKPQIGQLFSQGLTFFVSWRLKLRRRALKISAWVLHKKYSF